MHIIKNLGDTEIYKGNYESIIDVETFNKVSTLLKRQGKITGRKRIEPLAKIGSWNSYFLDKTEVLRMEFIITNVTDEEIDILEREDFDWCPDTLDSRDVVIDGNIWYLEKVLRSLGWEL